MSSFDVGTRVGGDGGLSSSLGGGVSGFSSSFFGGCVGGFPPLLSVLRVFRPPPSEARVTVLEVDPPCPF